ncbi:hypothetical protein AAZX31_04G200500 [Glycine max]|uniref:Uncharacterized protein n=1 Tax=Glycine max TaxID=3847 RepID=I1JY91_SOYBN|nr:uncharacterized protein LOC100800087 [Glycine max]KAG5035956.1 hypothetical protein JHK87_010866 [Glycine soja]KAG5050206.1 hypothetical protein JHK85_011309 [Glycine max]KAH1112586.1 hypothetical protein GYH30_010720 [Glycine max]KAH1255469.1 hypothetical protein GmHk_04G011616 [Glycine max]KRH64153.1 hypothetical protein GLYMA_04G219700v4 [Glycine max]|eukprot:XP_003523262.1 uncharacterized protein LOC100800087 [Glycine max]
MLGVGEKELTIENNNTIPWLILTQLIVLLLLFALLFFFTLLPLGPDDHHHNNLVTADTPPPPTTSSSVFFFDDIQIQQIDSPFTNHDSSPTHPPTTLQGGQNLLLKGEIATGPSPSMRREEEIMEEEEEEAASLYFHPCHYFQLATVAFLKCFGLDSTSDSPSTRRHRKRKES